MKNRFVRPAQRNAALAKAHDAKMARSSQAFVRGAPDRFYHWLQGPKRRTLPDGPAIWICGDCHVGNLGPVANTRGRTTIQIRDFDQSVIGNPAHDLVRLGLSLASAMRGLEMPGVATAKMLARIINDYAKALAVDPQQAEDAPPAAIRELTKLAVMPTAGSLALDCEKGADPCITLGKHFWPLSRDERSEITRLFAQDDMRKLATLLRSRDDDAPTKLIDAAYSVKGCSSLGRLRYAAIIEVNGEKKRDRDYCLMDLKEACRAVAPHAAGARMPADPAERVVEGARHLSPYLGGRIRAAKLLGKPIFVRELLPQDQKIEVERLEADEAIDVAGYLAGIVGLAHGRQMDADTRGRWRRELLGRRTKSPDVSKWLWTSVVELLAIHEEAYLEYCRRSVLQAA